MKRFYQDVTTGPGLDGGWVILLDGRPVRTPGKDLLCAPSPAMAGAVAQEWQAQGDTILPGTMPLTALLTTAIDRVAPERPAITQSVLSYLNGDLLCYRVEKGDAHGLDDEQARRWDPWLTWFAGRFGHTLHTTTTLSAFTQSDDAHTDISGYLSGLSLHQFNALQVATSLTGSIVLALALTEGSLSPEDAYACALCEELYFERRHKLEQHGLDPIEEKKRAALMTDLKACRAYLDVL